MNEYAVTACAMCGGGGLGAQLASRISALLQTSDYRQDTVRQLQRRLSIESGTSGNGSAYSGEEVQAEVDSQLAARRVLADVLRCTYTNHVLPMPRPKIYKALVSSTDFT